MSDTDPQPTPTPDPTTTPSPPTLLDLATACQATEQAYSAARAQADVSASKAAADKSAADQAHNDLRTAINALVAAAEAEDPSPAPSAPSA